MRRIQRHQTQQSPHQPSRRQRQHPPTEDKTELLPIHRPQIIIHQRHPRRRPSETLRRRDRQPQPRGQQYRNRRPQLRRKPSRRRHLRDLVAQSPHNVVPVPEGGLGAKVRPALGGPPLRNHLQITLHSPARS
ncbi:hypothetical protein IFM53868_05517 [Aspergillus udagawae]|uniref:Uncharacterized protein n=1 Tax=Aspergillus udagawae TaxID=91492 RepID=A0ABQ1AUV5_9EURO|nr:hypothetical protein IFM53868_05517 [Aspergillus udagawae]